jgi:hypothetical protein
VYAATPLQRFAMLDRAEEQTKRNPRHKKKPLADLGTSGGAAEKGTAIPILDAILHSLLGDF